jgi:DNA-directed RNA polymerase specialized sigma24 family protein
VPVSQALNDDPDGSPGDRPALEGDAVLCRYLRQQRFQGPAWDRFSHDLLAYGLSAIKGLIASGAIFGEVRKRGRSVSDSRWMLSPEDIDEIASDTVMRGYKVFLERGLIKGDWSASGGRTLAQYFRAACIGEFPNALRKRERDLCRQSNVSPIGDLAALDAVFECMPTNELDSRIEELTDLLSEQQMEIFALRHDGHSIKEVAEILGQPSKWVTNQISRARAKISVGAKKWRGAGE